jgi:hypothetical protein
LEVTWLFEPESATIRCQQAAYVLYVPSEFEEMRMNFEYFSGVIWQPLSPAWEENT